MKCKTCFERLALLPGWWLGAAWTRTELAKQAADHKERDEHLMAAAEYERRAKDLGGSGARRVA